MSDIEQFPNEEKRNQKEFDRNFGHLTKPLNDMEIVESKNDIDELGRVMRLRARIHELLEVGVHAGAVLIFYKDIFPKQYVNATEFSRVEFKKRAFGEAEQIVKEVMGDGWNISSTHDSMSIKKQENEK